MALLDDIKAALRVNDTDLDGEILDLIEAAKADLILSGVHESKVNDDTDPLIKRAITVYVKAHFGYDDMGERFAQSYESLKCHLALSTEYATGDTS